LSDETSEVKITLGRLRLGSKSIPNSQWPSLTASGANQLTVGGNLSAQSLGAVGDITLNGSLRAGGDMSGRNLSVTGDMSGRNLSVTGALSSPNATINGALSVIGSINQPAKLQVVAGAIVPSVGNIPQAGIQFPPNPGGGSGDEAFIRYFVTAGETTKLQIGIGNDTDDTIGLVQAGAERLTVVNGRIGIGNLLVTGAAFKPGGGSWGSTSDLRLKRKIEPLTGALEKLLQLRGVCFEWVEPEKMGNQHGLQHGLIAQEVESVFPEWISTGADGYKLLSIIGFEALMIEALRELTSEIESLKLQPVELAGKRPSRGERKNR
jgi:hypothetical protein